MLIIFHKDLTQKEASEKLEVSESTVKRIIKNLKNESIVERKGSKKDGNWVISS